MITNYASLINQFPVRNIVSPTKRTTWKTAEDKFKWLKELNDDLFKSEGQLFISRQDIFNNNGNIRKLIILTIYWGYTQGMRGNNFANILEKIEELEMALIKLKNNSNANTDDYLEFRSSLKNVKGIAMSTYSKLLYFAEVKINGHECLILDQRLLDAFSNESFSQFQDFRGLQYGDKAELKYPYVIEKLNNISKEHGFKPENLETFLFTFGKSLRIG